jgi:hypothetical protein
MGSRFISAVALYGPKTGQLRDFLAGVQALIAEHAGDGFLPYSLDQVHATLIALNGVPDPQGGAVVNEYYLMHSGARLQMDLRQVMDTLTAYFTNPLHVRFGGFQRHHEIPFTSRGQHLFERAFSVQENALVLVGWPVVSLTGPGRPLDSLRRAMNSANVLHRYHFGDSDVDNDLHLVLGHHRGAPAGALSRAEAAVRDKLAADPVDIAIGTGEVKIVAADSRTLAPPLYVSDIPADEAALLALMS